VFSFLFGFFHRKKCVLVGGLKVSTHLKNMIRQNADSLS